MRRKRLFWRLFRVYLAITLFSLGAIGILATRTVRDFYYSQTTAELGSIAELIKQQVGENFSSYEAATLDSLSKSLGRCSSTRVTLIRADGVVLGDTDEDPSLMENHADRPEFRKAIRGAIGTSVRYSPTLKDRRMYLAIPVEEKGEICGVVRVSISVAALSDALKGVYFWIALGGLVIAIFAALISYFVSRRISRPVEEMKNGAKRFAAGDYDFKLAIPDSEELGGLAEILNQTASKLREEINTITRQHNELDAVLKSMVEGVLAVDMEERLLRLNRAAGELLQVDPEAVRGRNLQEIIRNPDFQNFVFSILKSKKTLEDEIAFHQGQKYLRAHGTMLHNAKGDEIGALVVLNDVTRLRRLEKVRREFVANVSHELRTPITTIKGFAETLKDGAIRNPEEAERFLEIVAKHADRLNAIIEDLMQLSRIETDADSDQILLETGEIYGVVETAINACEVKAVPRKIKIKLEGAVDLKAKINAPLLEQAVINLLDNAIKYTEPGGVIQVSVETDSSEIRISVKDNGCGIAEEHLPRIFERFYRIDKNRSRKLAGTGLGLAIVKHIAIAHQGRVSVESEPGQGSTFRIHLPHSQA